MDDKLYDTPTVLMVNKSDLMAKTDFVVSKEDIEMEELANDLDICSWTRTSAKTGHGVEEGIRYTYQGAQVRTLCRQNEKNFS